MSELYRYVAAVVHTNWLSLLAVFDYFSTLLETGNMLVRVHYCAFLTKANQNVSCEKGLNGRDTDKIGAVSWPSPLQIQSPESVFCPQCLCLGMSGACGVF